ncbi:MAG: CoB--CoM heterodisulfide reductase iron-sulfur subunit B family protein [Candidatus Bathyarchaeia archaeon]
MNEGAFHEPVLLEEVMHYLAPIRNLIRVDEMLAAGDIEDGRLVTQCVMCWNTIKRANTAAKEDPDKMEKIRGIMEREPEYSGKVEVIHFLELLKEKGWDTITGAVKMPLEGLKVAPYYGCLLLRPREFALDDPDNPRIIEDLLESLGAEVVDLPYKSKCCGAYHAVHMKEVAAELSHKILSQATEMGADMVVTACPLCEFNLGKRQHEIQRLHPEFGSIPVVYYTQLMALAFGLNEEATGFDENAPDPRPLLAERGLILER